MVALVVASVLGLLVVAFLYVPRSTKSAKAKSPQPVNAYKVYDVTSYVEEHPGGDSILTHAGDDSTEGFYGPQHATRVFDMVDEFYIGDLQL